MSLPANTAPASPAAARELRDVRRGVAQAGDAQVLQVVRMVDALAERGETDAVLAPVRPRLRLIQPARPLRFARLLFLPADPLIVTPAGWRPGSVFLPRQGLAVLASVVRAIMAGTPQSADVLARTDAMIAGATTAQADIGRQAGALLWPGAARALRQIGALRQDAAGLTCFAEWAAQSLPAQELPQMAIVLAGVLTAAPRLHAAIHEGAGLAESVLADLLAATEPLGRRAWGTMLCLLVIRAPHACGALLAAAHTNQAQRPMAEMATEMALGWVEAETAAQPRMITEDAPGELNRQACLLDILAARPGDAARRRRLLTARAALQQSSLQRFESTLQDNVAAPLEKLPEAAQARDAALDAMETGARLLRAFELEARRLGGGAGFDQAVQGAEAKLRATNGLAPMDKARLVELLAGPDAALRLLG